MTLVASPFSWTNLFEYSPMGWGLLKLAVIMIVCSDIELSYILSFRCDPRRGLLQQTINTLFCIFYYSSLFQPPLYYPLSLLSPLSTISSLYYLLSPLSTIPSLYYPLSLLSTPSTISSLSTIPSLYYLLPLLSPLSTIPSLYSLLSPPSTIHSLYYPLPLLSPISTIPSLSYLYYLLYLLSPPSTIPLSLLLPLSSLYCLLFTLLSTIPSLIYSCYFSPY